MNREINLYAKIERREVTKLIMPNDYGQMVHPAPEGDNWYALHWPVNPHFTGEYGIAEILNELAKAGKLNKILIH